ncbi:MAG: hypothetical protein ACE5D6_04420 [Candidatus Zixiibacteriota bacterium]
MNLIYRQSVVIFFVTVIIRLLFHYLTGFTADDAFITFRYAENIAFGNGFVYNIGEKVLGTSTPLFTMLLSCFVVFAVKPLYASLLISLVSSGLTAVVLYRLALSLRFTRLAYVPALFYILWPRSVPVDISGMETAFFTLLITAGFYYQQKQKYFYSIGLATLASLTRPEGAWLLFILIIHNGYKDKFNWRYYLAVPLLLLGPWLLFSQFYFGSVIPHSIIAKLVLYNQVGTMSYFNNFLYLMAWHQQQGWLLTVAAVGGAYWLNKKQNYGWLELIWLTGMILFFTFSKTHLFSWYIVPIYPLYILFGSALMVWLFETIQSLKTNKSILLPVITVLMTGLLLAGLYPQMNYYRTFQNYLNSVNKEIGFYLYKKANSEKDIIAAEDIGYIGYYSRIHILDRDGLVSPEAVPYNRTGRYLNLILDYKPQWVGASRGSPISGFIDDSLFFKSYQLEKEFVFDKSLGYHLYSIKKIK